jgi:hypothetical protein
LTVPLGRALQSGRSRGKPRLNVGELAHLLVKYLVSSGGWIMTKTHHGDYRVTVKEDGDGRPFLMLEPSGRDMELLAGGFITLRLRDGTTHDEAQSLAKTMNDRIEGAAITVF